MYEWEDKTKKGRTTCRSCDEKDIDGKHLFQCQKLYGVGQKMWDVLKVFDPGIQMKEVFSLNLSVGHSQADWFLANVLFYIANNRTRCNMQSCKTYLLSEFEVLKRSKQCDDDLSFSVQIIMELFE